MAKKVPDKLFYKIGEVCDLTDTQPYVLRFWESEFPQLAPQKNRSGQRIYRRRDIETVEEIKRLLYDEGYTIAGARKRLEQEGEPVEEGRLPLLDLADAASEGAEEGEEASAAPAQGDEEERRRRVVEELREVLRLMQECDRKIAALTRPR